MERKVSFDDKPATKRVRTSLPPKLARRAKKSAARPSSSSSAATSRQVPFSSLSWAPVTLPSEAAGAGGSTETDFFDGLDENADDFMGLKEVEGVEVRYEEDGSGGKRVQFMMKEDQDGGKPEEVAMKGPRKGKDKGKGKGKGKADKAKAPLDSEEATDVAVLADDERSASYEGSGEPEINGKAQISQEMDEDEDEDEELDDEAIAGAFSGLDAADLMDLDGAEGAEEWLNDSFDGESGLQSKGMISRARAA